MSGTPGSCLFPAKGSRFDYAIRHRARGGRPGRMPTMQNAATARPRPERRAAHASMSAAMRQVRPRRGLGRAGGRRAVHRGRRHGTEATIVQAGESLVFPVKVATSTARVSYAFAVKEFDVEVSAAVAPDGAVDSADARSESDQRPRGHRDRRWPWQGLRGTPALGDRLCSSPCPTSTRFSAPKRSRSGYEFTTTWRPPRAGAVSPHLRAASSRDNLVPETEADPHTCQRHNRAGFPT